MQYLDYNTKNFPGLRLNKGSTLWNILQCDNYDAVVDNNATTLYHGFLTKFPKNTTVGNDIGSYTTRGIFLFADYTNKIYLQGFDDGTFRYLTGGTWTTINSGFSTDLAWDFASFNELSRIYYTNGKQAPYKWASGWTAGIPMQDKGADGVALTGTLTFTKDSTAVTGVGTAFTTELNVGSFIRKSSTTPWYEVATITDDTNLVLLTNYLESSGAGALGGSEKPSNASVRGRYIQVWKDRVFIASGDFTGIFILDTSELNDADALLS